MILLPLLVALAHPPVELLVFAGAASKPVLDEAAVAIRQELGVRLVFSYGGSGAVLTQMELARKGDLYIPGSHDWMERAVMRKLVDPTTRVDFVYLRPALLVRAGNPKRIQKLADLGREDVKAVIADPRTVCVGEYGLKVLQRSGLAEVLFPRLGRAASCEAVANLLATASVDAVLGWDVFEHWFPGQIEEVPLPSELVEGQATIPGAVAVFSQHRKEAQAVLLWLGGPAGKAVWRKYGYRTEP